MQQKGITGPLWNLEVFKTPMAPLAETSSDVIQESVVSNFFNVIFHFLLFCYLYSQGFIHPSLPLISFKLRCVSRDWLLSLNGDCVPSMRRYKASHPPWAISSCMWWWIQWKIIWTSLEHIKHHHIHDGCRYNWKITRATLLEFSVKREMFC